MTASGGGEGPGAQGTMASSGGSEGWAPGVGPLQRLAGETDAAFAERLVPALADEDEAVRDAAARQLGGIPDATEVLRAFLGWSGGAAPWLRERAKIAVLASLADVAGSLACLMQDPGQDVRAGAVAMASDCGDPRILPGAIGIFLGTDDWWIRIIAAGVLGHHPSPEVTGALLARLDDPDLRPSVIAALGKMRDADAAAALVGLLGAAERGTRAAALDALAAHERPEVYGALQRTARHDPDPALRDRSVAILERHRPATDPYLRELAQAGDTASANACGDEEPLCMENEPGPF